MKSTAHKKTDECGALSYYLHYRLCYSTVECAFVDVGDHGHAGSYIPRSSNLGRYRPADVAYDVRMGLLSLRPPRACVGRAAKRTKHD